MKLKKLSLFFCVLLLLTACKTKEEIVAKKNSTFEEKILVDMTGKERSIKKEPKRIIALTASDCEIIYALGAGDNLIARGEFCDYPQSVLDLPSIESGNKTNIEQILALKPDLVFMNKMAQSLEQSEEIEALGIPIIVNNAKNTEEIYESIIIIGKALDKNGQALKLVSEMKQKFEQIKVQSLENNIKATVYFEVSPLEWGLYTAGKDTFMNEIAEMIGLENIFSDLEGWQAVSQEQVIARNPDIIVTVTMYSGKGIRPENEILNRDGWQNINAVINNKVFIVDSDEITRPGPRIVKATEKLMDLINDTTN